ncbi:MAG: zinc ribbon domain-containing protein, partial [Gemmatimonadota bacterium]|nr:zinc ribbon domain-containing protein [Gemmatimonadota bacterium]
MENCPDCLSEVPEAAVVCSSCGERMTGRRCTACGARNWEEARLCRWCGTSFEPTGHGLEF